MPWQLAGILGLILGTLVGAVAAHNRYSQQIQDLRIALGNIVRVLDRGDIQPYVRARLLQDPLIQARKVLKR